MIDFWADLRERYPIVSIEDGLAEDDWDALGDAHERLGDRVQLVGDDLFVTNVERLRRGIERSVAQRDPRQGEPDRHADRDARRDRARAGERLHGGHLAPLGRDRGHDDRRPRGRDAPGQIKTGAPARSDRVAKYNQLLRIEEELGDDARSIPGWARSRGRAASLSTHGRRSTPHEDRRHDRARVVDARRAARRSRRGWTARGSTSRTARTRSTPSARELIREPRRRDRPAGRADRRPAGAEAPHRRPDRAGRARRAASSVDDRRRGRRAATATSRSRRRCSARCSSRGTTS